MKGLLGLMEKAGLVQLSDAEKEPEAPAPVQAVSEPAAFELDLGADASAATGREVIEIPPEQAVEETPLEQIFELAALPPSPFPAERLLRLLDGLRAMDSGTRKMAVQAMDAADDAWSIDDPVADAERKIAALDAFKRSLAARMGQAESDTARGIEDVKAGLERATGEIRAQMAQLEQLLQRELSKAAEDTARLEAALRATREGVARETLRMDKEIERLGEIPATFGRPGTTN